MPAELTSLRSPRIAAARRLLKRAYRRGDRKFLAEGPQAVREALDADPGAPGAVLEMLVTADAAARHADLVERARGRGTPVHQVSGGVLGELTSTVTPQGILAICSFLEAPLEAVVEARPELVALLCAVRDPGNAGTVIRTADAAGAGAVVLTDSSVDIYNGKCVRASAGSLWHLPVAAGVPVEAAVEALHAAGLSVLAADGAGDVDLDELDEAGTLAQPTAWLFGNEAWGLPAEVRALADRVVRVPMYGRAESLNLATAAAVCMYATARAQHGRRTRQVSI